MRLQQQQSGVFYNQFLQPAMRRGLLWKKCATSRLGKGAILSYPTTEGDSNAHPVPKPGQGAMGTRSFWQHLKLLGNPLFSCDLEDGCLTHVVSGHVLAGRTHRALLPLVAPGSL